MRFHDNTTSATEVAKGLFEYVGSTDPSLDRLTRQCLELNGVDEVQFSEEVHYLRAFVVYYSTWRILGESAQGRALRAAFMGLWDSAAKTSSAHMHRYNEFFRRLQAYVDAMHTGDAAQPSAGAAQVAKKFAELLGAEGEAVSRPACEAAGSAWFASTCDAVEEALRGMISRSIAASARSRLLH